MAWTVFESYRGKGWSFTDCVSRAVIERLGIGRVFTFDAHFREFGNVTVVPQML
jgi:predicted nucleic acid-binding protein